MALTEAVDHYLGALSALSDKADAVVLRNLSRDDIAEIMADDDDGSISRELRASEAALDDLADAAERYLSASDQLESEFGETHGEVLIRLAAFMDGHWLAATFLTVTASDTVLAETKPMGADSLRRVLIAAVPDSEELGRLVMNQDTSVELALIAHGTNHDLPEIALGLRGESPVQGGAVDPVHDAVTRIVKGLASSANSIAASAAAGGLLQHLQAAAASFVHGPILHDAPAGAALGRIQQLALVIVKRAEELIRKFIGESAVDQIEAWVNDHVSRLLKDAETKAVRRVLQLDELEKICKAALQSLQYGEAQSRLDQLDRTMASYNTWAKWGKRGTRLLAYLPAAALGPAALPTITVAVAALLSYQVWIAWDHLDWPDNWPLHDHVTGVGKSIGDPGQRVVHL